MRRLRGIDAAFLHMETPAMHFHVVGVVVLEPVTRIEDPYERMRSTLLARLHLITPLRHRLLEPPARIGSPMWIEDPDFDIDDHVFRARLPEPGDRQELQRFVSEVSSTPLTRNKPLWEMWVVEGLEGGRFALVSKMHHATMDGSAGSDMMGELFDLTPEGQEIEPPVEPWQPDRVPSMPEVVARGLVGRVRDFGTLPRVAADSVTGVARAAATTLRRRGGEAALPTPMAAPRTPWNGTLSSARSVSFVEVPFADVKAVKEHFGVTVNDVVLAATASSLRAYLAARDALPDKPLVMSVPVATRTADQRDFDNRVSGMLVAVPVTEPDPVVRLCQIHDNAIVGKELHGALGGNALEQIMGVTPPALLAGGIRIYQRTGFAGRHAPVQNIVVSNVPGPPIPLYIGGAKVRAVYPMGPLIEGSGLNLTVLSCVGMLDVGVMADPSLVDDPDAVTDGFAAGVQELLALTG